MTAATAQMIAYLETEKSIRKAKIEAYKACGNYTKTKVIADILLMGETAAIMQIDHLVKNFKLLK